MVADIPANDRQMASHDLTLHRIGISASSVIHSNHLPAQGSEHSFQPCRRSGWNALQLCFNTIPVSQLSDLVSILEFLGKKYMAIF